MTRTEKYLEYGDVFADVILGVSVVMLVVVRLKNGVLSEWAWAGLGFNSASLLHRMFLRMSHQQFKRMSDMTDWTLRQLNDRRNHG